MEMHFLFTLRVTQIENEALKLGRGTEDILFILVSCIFLFLRFYCDKLGLSFVRGRKNGSNIDKHSASKSGSFC